MASIESVFGKKKKGKKKGMNLNHMGGSLPGGDDGAPKQRLIHDQILGSAEADGDGGWVDDVEKKRTVATGGKKVAELIDLNALQTVDEVVAQKLYLEEQKRDFVESREAAQRKEDAANAAAAAAVAAPKEETKSVLGGFGVGGWRERQQQRELEMRKKDLGSSEAFPTLGGGAPAPVGKEVASGASVWGKAPAAIKASKTDGVLAEKPEDGRTGEDEGEGVQEEVQSSNAPSSGGGEEEEEEISAVALMAKKKKKKKKPEAEGDADAV
jgi:hypothetical protein